MSRESDELGEEQWNNQFLPDWPFTENPPAPENLISDEELVEDMLRPAGTPSLPRWIGGKPPQEKPKRSRKW